MYAILVLHISIHFVLVLCYTNGLLGVYLSMSSSNKEKMNNTNDWIMGENAEKTRRAVKVIAEKKKKWNFLVNWWQHQQNNNLHQHITNARIYLNLFASNWEQRKCCFCLPSNGATTITHYYYYASNLHCTVYCVALEALSIRPQQHSFVWIFLTAIHRGEHVESESSEFSLSSDNKMPLVGVGD